MSSDRQTTGTHTIGRMTQRQTFVCRLPATLYYGEWRNTHDFLSRYTPRGKYFSNSVVVRLGLYALQRLYAQARVSGSEAIDELGRELAREAQAIAGAKRWNGPATVRE